MKNLQQLESRLSDLEREYKEYIRCHVRNCGKYFSYDPDSIDKINQLQRNIFNTKININQVKKMRMMNGD